MAIPLLQVKISNPDKVVWKGEAYSVSSINSKGPFDILPMHANFVTVIDNKPIKIRIKGKTLEYTYPQSVLYTHNNTVLIYTNL